MIFDEFENQILINDQHNNVQTLENSYFHSSFHESRADIHIYRRWVLD